MAVEGQVVDLVIQEVERHAVVHLVVVVHQVAAYELIQEACQLWVVAYQASCLEEDLIELVI